jgi:hypothetical protein
MSISSIKVESYLLKAVLLAIVTGKRDVLEEVLVFGVRLGIGNISIG